MKSRQTCYSVIVLILFLCVSIGLSACFPFEDSTQEHACHCPPPPFIWQAQQDTFASNAAGAFAFRILEITPQQFRFYYVYLFASARYSSIHVSVNAVPSATPSSAVSLAVTNQSLGHIGAYQVGVLHIARRSQAGQVIAVAITPVSSLGVAGPTWDLAPLKQLGPEPPRMLGALAPTGGLPQVQWSGFVMEQDVSYVKVIIPGQPVADRSYVFLRSDDPVTVIVLTKAQYLAFAGANNFTP